MGAKEGIGAWSVRNNVQHPAGVMPGVGAWSVRNNTMRKTLPKAAQAASARRYAEAMARNTVKAPSRLATSRAVMKRPLMGAAIIGVSAGGAMWEINRHNARKYGNR